MARSEICSPAKSAATAGAYLIQPYLHYLKDKVYNPLTDSYLLRGDPGFKEIVESSSGKAGPLEIDPALVESLFNDRWLVKDIDEESKAFFLKYVSLEAHSVCNQACHFCPVSVAPRGAHEMSSGLYERILEELSAYRNTLRAVFMNQYNEPSIDRRFIWQVETIHKYGLPPAVLSNGSGLTPQRVDRLVEAGGVVYLNINLSTMDRDLYEKDRGVDQLPLVLRNLDYLKGVQLAPLMEMNVLGAGDDVHRENFDHIKRYFAGSNFDVKYYRYNDRGSYLDSGMTTGSAHEKLLGCEQLGSRPLQHLHITAEGKCVLCCQDYNERHIVGDLTSQSVSEVLTGEAMIRARKWAYGIEESPEDFLCRRCVFAITCKKPNSGSSKSSE